MPNLSNKIEELEIKSIVKALKEAEGNIVEASRILGISIPTVYSKIEKYGIEIERIIKVRIKIRGQDK